METSWEDHGIFDRRITNGTNGNFKTRCVRCGDKNSLSVNTIKKVWQCHRASCRWSGCLYESNSTSFSKPAQDSYTLKKLAEISNRAIEWLKARGLNPALATKYGMKSRLWVDKDFKKAETIAFPMVRNGELVNLAYRRFWNDPPLPAEQEHKGRYFFYTGGELCLINTEYITKDTTTLYWVEGWPDGLALETAVPGIEWVSIPNGSPKLKEDGTLPNIDGRLQCIDRQYEKLKNIKRHVLMLDNDEPGQVMTGALARRLNASKCHVPVWPVSESVKVKDPGDVLKHLGAEVLREMTESYVSFPLEGLASESEIHAALSSSVVLRCDAYVDLPGVDKLFGFVLGYAHFLIGPPSVGKSTMLSDFTRRIVQRYGWRIGILSGEDTLRDYLRRTISQASGIPTRDLSPEEIKDWGDWFHAHYSWIKGDEVTTVEQCLELAAALVEQKGIRILEVDPLSKFESQRTILGMSEVEYLNYLMNRFTRFAKRYQVAVVVVYHPVSLRERDGTTRQVGGMYDGSGGAQIPNLADTVNCNNIITDKHMKPIGDWYPAKFQTFKCRQKPELGDVGWCYLWFNRYNKRFAESPGQDGEGYEV